MKRFIASCVQIAITPNAVKENLEKVETWLEMAVRQHGAELVVFPETVTTGFSPGLPVEGLWDLVDAIPGSITAPIARAARDLGVHVVLPTYERGPERGTVFNSAVLIDPHGEIVGLYRKTHPFPAERLSGGGWSTPGRQADRCR